MATGAADYEQGPVCTTRFADLPAGEHLVELWLPHNETTELVELRTDAPVSQIPASNRPVWLHHGSSISHGSNSATPTGIWPAVAARLGGADLVNLGFGGSALLDQFTARAMRDTPADIISVKIGINLVNTDLMRLRAFRSAVHGFIDTLRDGHPTTPLLVITPIYCGIHEHTPGPGAFDQEAIAAGKVRFIATGDPAEERTGKLTLTSIRAELDRIIRERAATDPNLHLLDGLTLYGEQDAADHPLPDALHPDAETHRSIGERFARLAFEGEGPFSSL
nr:GDSL-type esterase/lipase family protein [Lysinibacter cavernae]